MPFCPKCRSQFIEGTSTCEDCSIALVSELPAANKKVDDRDLVEVWKAQGEMEAQLVRSLLESNGIDSIFSGEALRLTHGFTLDGLAVVRILVREDDVTRACDVIAAMDGMQQCQNCRHPAYDGDAACHYCKTPFEDPESS